MLAKTSNSKLESNLDAISKTPKIHREELENHVHQPLLIPLTYPSGYFARQPSPAMKSLQQMYQSLDIAEDPWIISMKSDPVKCLSPELTKALMSGQTLVRYRIGARTVLTSL